MMFWTVIGACVVFTVALFVSHILTYKNGHDAGREQANDHWRPKFNALAVRCAELEHKAKGTLRPWMIRPLSPAELRPPQPSPVPTGEPTTGVLPRREFDTGEFEAIIDQIRAGTYPLPPIPDGLT
jgi:hypothetical protein